MSVLLPSLQKFYNALKHLEQFSVESSFFDNIGCIDVFLSEFRSTTLVLQESLGGSQDPIYLKNLNEYLLKDEKIAKWLNNQRVTVIHKHPFSLKKILRIVIYDTGRAIEFKRYEQTLEDDKPIENYEQVIRETFLSLSIPEICFSAQYVYVDENDASEVSIFDLIEPGITAMWRFLHAMKEDLADDNKADSELLVVIDDLVMRNVQRWLIGGIDYSYYRSTDSFERGSLISMKLPDVHSSVERFMELPKNSKAPIKDFFDAFIWMHSMFYFLQKGNILTTFFVEYEDKTYRTLSFAATLRTTFYRFINRVASIVSNDKIVSVLFVTEMVSYPSLQDNRMANFYQMNYREKESLRQNTLLSFYKIDAQGNVFSVRFDADNLIDELRKCSARGGFYSAERDDEFTIMLTPIVDSFKAKLSGA